MGFVKRTKLSEFKVQRYSKPMSMMKIKDKDEVIDVTISSDPNVFVATKNGYGLWYKANEISEVGLKAAGVKSINLKDDEVVKGLTYDVGIPIDSNIGCKKNSKERSPTIPMPSAVTVIPN